jgi:hypothetical protein
VLLLGFLLARGARAQEPAVTRLEYRVPEGCPAVAEFERRVHLRSARIRFLNTGDAPRALYVQISTNSGASIGTLRLVESDGSDHRRGFQATSCEDAVDGLALIAAVALDPEGAAGLAPTPPPPPPPPPPKPAPRVAGPEMPVLEPIALRVRGGNIGVGGSAIDGLLPRTIGGLYFSGELDLEYRDWLAPAIRLSATLPLRESDFGGADGSAKFSMVTTRLEVCPVRLGSPKANVRPCVSGAIAIIGSTGVNALYAGSEVRPVWIPGLSVVASWRFLGRLALFLNAGIGAPMPRYEYVFRAHDPTQPNVELFSTKPEVVHAGAGLALDLP